jgi:hypothetical protein
VDARLSATRDNPPQQDTTSRRPVTVDPDADTTARRKPVRRSTRTARRAARRYHDPHHNGTAGPAPDATTTNTHGRRERGKANTHPADYSAESIVIIQPEDFRLPEVLRHIEAGKIVLVSLEPHRPD